MRRSSKHTDSEKNLSSSEARRASEKRLEKWKKKVRGWVLGNKRQQPRPRTFEPLEPRQMLAVTTVPDELFDLGNPAVEVDAALIDQDGRADLVALDGSGQLTVALNNGDDTWRQFQAYDSGLTNTVGFVLADLDGDQNLDVVIQGEDALVVAFGDGQGNFTTAQTLSPAAAGDLAATSGATVGLATGLVDTDEYADVLVVVPGADQLLVYRGNGAGLQSTPTSYASGATGPIDVELGNFIGDEATDAVVAHEDGSLTFFEGNGDGTFTYRSSLTVSGLGTIRQLSSADYDEDGDTDLVVASSGGVKVLSNDDDTLITSPLANGEFYLGLTDWETTGDVSALAGFAQLRESDSSLLTTLQQTFVLPTGAQTISFDLESLGLETPTANGLPDVFEASLLDGNGNSLVATHRAEATSFFNVQPDGTAAVATGVTFDGTTVTLDVSGVSGGTTVTLFFDLLGNPGGLTSSVIIDDVKLDPDTYYLETFSQTALTGPFTDVQGLITADVDGDGYDDLIVADHGADKVVVFNGDGTGSFTRDENDVSTYGSGPRRVAAAPLDALDSTDDFIVSLDTGPDVLTPLQYVSVIDQNLYRVPGSTGEWTEVIFTWVDRNAGYNNELGFFIVDDLQARVDGLLPGDAGYIEAALGQPGRQIVFGNNQTEGAVTSVMLPAGTLITPYLVQNDHTGNLIRNNPSGSYAGSPKIWLLHAEGNSDGSDHFIVEVLPDGRVQYGAEDLTDLGDADYDDMVFTVQSDIGEPLPEGKFFVVDDIALGGFRYTDSGEGSGQTGLALENASPRGVASNALGDTYWVVDADKHVYVYDDDGNALGSWEAFHLNTPTGIATDGTDIWIVDSNKDRVYYFQGAASRLSGSLAPTSSFKLTGGNNLPSDLVTDGEYLWVVDEGADKVFVYTVNAQLEGSWSLDAANGDASGITRDVAGDLWVVDRSDERVYQYADAMAWRSGSHSATSTFDLDIRNRKPEGIADPPTPINIGDEVSGSLVPSQIDQYTFSASAGDLVYFEADQAPWYKVKWRVIGPSGTIFDKNFSDADTEELPDTGTYTLEVESTSHTGSYWFKLWDVPATSSTALNFDTQTTGSLDVPGERDEFTFTGSVGQELYFQVHSGSWNNMRWTLKGPSGNVFTNKFFQDQDVTTLSAAGTYTLEVDGVDTYTYSNYSFTVWDVPATSSTPISLDTEITASLDVPGERDHFTFSGTAGQTLYFQVLDGDWNDMRWTLTGPSGDVFTNKFFQDVDVTILPDTGTYTLEVDGWKDYTHTDYRFKVWDVPPITPVPINWDTQIDGSNDVPGEVSQFTFEGAVNQRLFFDKISGGYQDVNMTLIGPSGVIWGPTLFDDRDPVDFTEEGTYTIEIDNKNATTGAFSFKLVDVPEADVQAIQFGELVEGDITIPGEVDHFTFSAASGAHLYFDRLLGGTLGTIDATWRLFGPSGQVWSSAYTDKDTVLTETGNYTLEIDGNDSKTGSYKFQVFDVPDTVTVPLDIDTVVNASIDVPGEANHYSFTAPAGQQLLFDALSGGLQDYNWTLTGPSGNLFGPTVFGDQGPITLSEGGDYLLEIKSAGGATGAYSFQVVDVAPQPSVPLVLGETVNADIGTAGETDVYAFDGTPGQQVYFQKISGFISDFSVTLLKPDGTALFSGNWDDQDTMVLDQLGEYQLRVQGSGGHTGAYSFALYDVPLTIDVPIWPGQIVSGDIAVPGEEHRYEFEGETGDQYFFDVQEWGNYLDPLAFKLVNPDGSELYPWSEQDRGVFSLTQSGTYAILAGATGATIGDYRFRLVKQSGDLTLPINVNTTYTDQVDQGQLLTYEFDATTGEGILLDIRSNDGSAPFSLIAPSGATVFSGESTSYLVDALPETGTYKLEVGGNGNDQAGAYQFRLQQTAAPAVGTPDASGTEFWVAIPAHHRPIGNVDASQNSVLISSHTATSGTVSIPSLDFYASFEVAAGGSTTVNLPSTAELGLATEVTIDKGIHITALDEVTVHVQSYMEALSDGYLAMPVDALGTDYLALGYENTGVGLSVYMDSTHFAVVATEDNTQVTITPSVTTGTHTAGVPYIVALNAGDVYQLTNTDANPADLSGSSITADKPIGVLVGNGAVTIPQGTAASDYLVEQILPTTAWGQTYYSVPLATRTGGDLFRIMAAQDTTQVSIDGTVVATLDRGEFYETTLTAASEITGDKPIAVAQFSYSSQYDLVEDADPFQVMLPAADQWLDEYRFATPATGYDEHYLNLVVPTSTVGEVALDGTPISAGQFTAIGSTGYSAATVILPPGVHELTGPLAFGATVYGYAYFDGYGFPVGTSAGSVTQASSLALTPASTSLALGSQHVATATVENSSGQPLAGVRVDFAISGTQTLYGNAITDASGQAQFVFTGSDFGTDTITATTGDLLDTAQVTWDTAAPTITVLSPADGSELTTGSTVLLSGQAFPGTPLGRIVDVTVNGIGADSLDRGGRFFHALEVAAGTNTITIEATNEYGLTATQVIEWEGVTPGSTPLEEMAEVTGAAQLNFEKVTYNRQSREIYADVRLQNVAEDALAGPMHARFDLFTPAGPDVTTPDGTTTEGKPLITFDTEIAGGALASLAESDPVSVVFDQPTDDRFGFVVSLLSETNRAPRFLSSPSVDATIGVAYEYQLAADVAVGTAAFSLLENPNGMTVDSGGLVTWTPTSGQEGTHRVVVQVADGHGGYAQQAFEIWARSGAPNRAPEFQSPPVTQINSGNDYLYLPDVFDLDGDTLTFYLDQNPSGMTVNSSTGQLDWTSPADGNYTVELRAEDGQGGKAVQQWTLTVGSGQTNTGIPTLQGIPNAEAVVDVLWTYQPQADDPDGDTLTFSLIQQPTGMSVDTATGRLTWTPDSGQTGNHTVELKVDDANGGIATRVFTVNVSAVTPNRPPEILSSPPKVISQDEAFSTVINAADPDGDALTFTLVEGPTGMSLDASSGVLSWTPTSADLGSHAVRVKVEDPSGAAAWQSFSLEVRSPNQAPAFSSTPVTTVEAETTYRYYVEATDSEDEVTLELIDAPTGMVLDLRSGLLWWRPTATELGGHNVTVRATDERGASVDQTFTVSVVDDATAPSVAIRLSADTTDINVPITITVYATDNVDVTNMTLTADGNPLTLDGNNQAVYTPTAAGLKNIVATASDAQSNVGNASETLRVRDPADTTAPTVDITSPTANTMVEYLTDIAGTVTDTNLEFWNLAYSRLDTDQWTVFAEGTAEVTASVLGSFDPTILQNDQYLVRLLAGDFSGNTASTELPVELTGGAKIGNFQLQFTDLNIPLAGIPISVMRTYDTLTADESGDFGFGWKLAWKEANIRETVLQNPIEPLSGPLVATPFREGTRLYITAPSGERMGFTFTPEDAGLFGESYVPRFTADPGIYAELSVTDNGAGDPILVKGPDDRFYYQWSSASFNPSKYTLTLKDGTQYHYDQWDGLEQVEDRNGNTVTFDENGIYHSSGESITFVRDTLGRITQIVDPASNTLNYTYDGNGDLVQFEDRGGEVMVFVYSEDRPHYLVSMESDCGCTKYVRAEYDENGRVVSRVDADGNTIESAYDLENQTETITDRLGNPTQLEFDDRGNITATVDPLGRRTEYAYDGNDNVVSYTDARGYARTFSYDASGNLTTLTDQEGGLTQFTYNDQDQITSATDALNHKMTFEYDATGNLTTFTNAEGNTVSFTYDGQGRALTSTNLAGENHSFTYQDGRRDPSTIQYPDGTTVTHQYNYLGLPTATTDQEGRQEQYLYDANGLLIGLIDKNGEQFDFVYEDNRLVSITDRLDRTTAVEYDAQGRLAKRTLPDGSVVLTEYDAEGRLVQMVDPIGQVTEYEYDNAGQLIQQRWIATEGENPLEAYSVITRHYAYDDAGNRIASINENGHGAYFTYDGLNRVVAATDAAGSTISFEYDAAGNLIKETDELGRVWSYSYDALNRLLSVLDPINGMESYTYDSAANLTSITDANQNTTSYEYDQRNRLSKIVDAASNEILFGYDGVGNLTSMTDRLGHTTQYVYDNLDRMIERIDALGNSSYRSYDDEGNLLTYQDEESRLWQYGYDAMDRLVSVTDPLLGVRTYTYDSIGRVLTNTDQNNHSITYAYDQLGRNVQVSNALGYSNEFQYDGIGNLVSMTDPLGRVTTYNYDELERLSSVTDPAGYTVEFAYDRASNLIQTTDQAGYSTEFIYDDLDRLITTVDANGGQTRSVYDAVGNQIEFYDELNRKTEYQYNELNRLTKTIDPRLAETTFTYDAVGNVTKVVDPLSNETLYEYDALNRLTKRTDPLSNFETFEYDKVSNLTRTVDRNGRERTFEYDALDRQTAEKWWDTSTLVHQIDYTYDPVGNLLSASDAYSQYTYTYDANDRVTSVDNAGTPGVPNVVLSYAYDAYGNAVSISDNLGATVRSEYDERNLLVRREWEINAIDEALALFDYDERGQLTSIDRYADIAQTGFVGKSEFVYDALGRTTDISHKDSALALIADYDYTWDVAHQLVSQTHHGETITFTHDDAGQLTSADYSTLPDENYTYDENGNRIGGGYTIGPNNQVLSDGTYNYTYDAEGNLLTKTEIATGEVTTYSYDHRNRLVKVETHSSGGILLAEVTFVYDVFDRRIGMTVDADGEGPGTAETTRFVYDGDHVWAEFDGAGNLVARYLYGDRIDQLLARWRASDGVSWYLTDHLGTVRDIVDASGTLVNTITYDSFGRVLSETNPTAGDRYKFTGREWIPEIELYYYRARFYDPVLGRFISQDPLGFGAGDPNLYRYVGNSPLTFMDPSGQSQIEYKKLLWNSARWAPAIAAGVCGVRDLYIMANTPNFPWGKTIAATAFLTSAFLLLGMYVSAPIVILAAIPVMAYGIYNRGGVVLSAANNDKTTTMIVEGACMVADIALGVQITLPAARATFKPGFNALNPPKVSWPTRFWPKRNKPDATPESGGPKKPGQSPETEGAAPRKSGKQGSTGGDDGVPTNCFVAGTLVHHAKGSESEEIVILGNSDLWIAGSALTIGLVGLMQHGKTDRKASKKRSIARVEKLDGNEHRTW